ncbi:hypothetical protein ABZ863_27500 [Saccharomonospora sp. NPDC046836]|uniref:hypothetical protein n=1 Tax=Saccharomonospora sp. NPDC046836 TaxID=3156921 RepID=UPI00340CBA20
MGEEYFSGKADPASDENLLWAGLAALWRTHTGHGIDDLVIPLPRTSPENRE